MKATYLVKIPTQRARSLVYDPVSISSETLVTVYKSMCHASGVKLLLQLAISG